MEEKNKDIEMLKNPRSWVVGLIGALGLMIAVCCPEGDKPIGKFLLWLACQEAIGWSLVFGAWALARKWQREGKLDIMDED